MLEACSRLSPKQLQFCREYLHDLNATAAYKRVYQVKNAATAAACAARLLTNAKVQEQIQALMAERSQRTAVTADRVLEEIGCVAFSNIRDFVSWGPDGITLKHSEELEEGQSRAIVDINSQEMEHGGVHTRVKLFDKLSALKLLAQHVGLLGDLNQAMNVLRRYGYEIVKEESGYKLLDSYLPEKREIELDSFEDE